MEETNREYPYDSTTNVTEEISHEVDITTVVEWLTKKNISVSELPEVVAINAAHAAKENALSTQLENARDLIRLLRTAGGILWENIKNNMGDSESWDWVKDNLTEEMRDELDISIPRKYKIVDVTLTKTLKLAVPECFDTYQIEELATDIAENRDYDCSVDERRGDVDEADLTPVYLDNDPSEFDDTDFE